MKSKLVGPFTNEAALFATFDRVGDAAIARWEETDVAEAHDGCLVDTSKYERCSHGYPTWLLTFGLKLMGGRQTP